jgi:hypothetical protein
VDDVAGRRHPLDACELDHLDVADARVGEQGRRGEPEPQAAHEHAQAAPAQPGQGERGERLLAGGVRGVHREDAVDDELEDVVVTGEDDLAVLVPGPLQDDPSGPLVAGRRAHRACACPSAAPSPVAPSPMSPSPMSPSPMSPVAHTRRSRPSSRR